MEARSGTAVAGPGRAAPEALRRRAELVGTLVVAQLRERFGRGRMRIAKWILDPFVLVGVYLAFVTLFLDRGGAAPGLSLACAVVPFQILTMSVHSSLTGVREHSTLLLNAGFPRGLLPVATAFTEAVGFGASLLLIVAMMAVYGIAPTAALLWLPLVLAVTMALAIAAGYAATLFGIWFPELQNFVRSLVRATYFLAPGLIALSQIPPRAAELARINPLSGVFESFRDVFLYGTAPAAWEIAIPLAWTAGLLAACVPVYRREAAHLAKVV